MQSLEFKTVLRDELKALRSDLKFSDDATLRQLYDSIDKSPTPTAALCLSGGGIRSAAFALGFLQGLARFGLLDKFHYLSTVSGGGYVGGWLTAWRHHAASDTAVFNGLDRTSSSSGEEAAEIRGLRAGSNYLTPQVGLLSADTWAAIALFIRNLVLNWLVFIPFFMGVLYFPWLCDDLLQAISDRPDLATPLMRIGVVAITIGLVFASYGRRRAAGRWLTNRRFILLALGPIVIAAMGFTGALAALHDPYPTLGRGTIGGGACYGLAWLLASAFRIFDPAPSAARAAWVDRESLVKDFISWIIAGAVAGCLLAAGMQLSVTVVVYRTKWLTVLGSSWVMLSIFGGELIYVGLRSYAKRGDMDREWLGRASGWLAAGAVSWALFAAVALLGPFALETGHAYIVTSVAAAGGLSGVIALVFGSSAKTAATKAVQVAHNLTMSQIASLAGVIFAVFLAASLSLLDGRLSDLVTGLVTRHIARPQDWMVDAGGVGTAHRAQYRRVLVRQR